MSGTKHLKKGVVESTSKKKKVKGTTDARDPRGIPTMVMGPSGKLRMEWR